MNGEINLAVSSTSGLDQTAVGVTSGLDQATLGSAVAIDQTSIAKVAGIDDVTGTSLKYEEMITNGSLFADANADGLADNFTAPTGTPSIVDGCQKVTESAAEASLSYAVVTQKGIDYILEVEYKSDKGMHADIGSVQLDLPASVAGFTNIRSEFVSPGAASVVLSLVATAEGDSFTIKKLSLLPANVNQLSIALDI
jgi:hypothetical protein